MLYYDCSQQSIFGFFHSHFDEEESYHFYDNGRKIASSLLSLMIIEIHVPHFSFLCQTISLHDVARNRLGTKNFFSVVP